MVWKPGFFLQQFFPQRGAVRTELRPPPIANTETYGASIRSAQGPGAAAAAKIFYREPPEQPHVESEPYLPTLEVLMAIVQAKDQAPIKTYGATTH